MITDNFSVWAELQSVLLWNCVDWALSFVYTVSPSENLLGMRYKPAWGLWWLIAWTGWWPSAGPCNLPVSTWNYEAEGLMGFQVIEPRCPKVGCSRFHRFARLWSLSIIYFLLKCPSPIFTQLAPVKCKGRHLDILHPEKPFPCTHLQSAVQIQSPCLVVHALKVSFFFFFC